MPDYTQGDTRPVLKDTDLASSSVVLDTRRTRPLWFDGRFLAARDLQREQNYALQREADLARAPGFGVIDGLMVDMAAASAGAASGDIVISAGHGVTPAGELVDLPGDLTVRLADLVEEPALDVRFGIARAPMTQALTRTGLYVIALRPVQFTANPITAYPVTVRGTAASHPGDIVEATSVCLVTWPLPSGAGGEVPGNAALARQIFVTGASGGLSDALLPLAMVSISGGSVVWLDNWLVRRQTGVASTGLRFGLTDPAGQQAFLLQYDAQLQQAAATATRQQRPADFPASSFCQAMPPAGRFPLASIDANAFTQSFFPPQMDVRLSIVPDDELPALMQDSLSLPPIDLTLAAEAYANLTVTALIPVPRQGYAALEGALPNVAVTSVLTQVLGNRRPIDLLRFYQGSPGTAPVSGTNDASWRGAIGGQTYGYYIRRRSAGSAVTFRTPPPPPTTTPAPTTTALPTTTSVPTTTTASPATTTVPPTTTTVTSTTAPPTTTTAAPTTTTVTSTTVPPTTTTTPPTTTTVTSTTTAPPTTTTAPPTTTTPRPTTTTPRPPPTTTTIRTTRPIETTPRRVLS
jgi:hypothetical protein